MYFTFYVDVMEWCCVLTRSTQCYLSENNFSEETIQLRRREIAKLFLSATSGKGGYFTEANFEELTFQNYALNKKRLLGSTRKHGQQKSVILGFSFHHQLVSLWLKLSWLEYYYYCLSVMPLSVLFHEPWQRITCPKTVWTTQHDTKMRQLMTCN